MKMKSLSSMELNILAIALTLFVAAAAIACGVWASTWLHPHGKPLWLSAASTCAGGVLISAAVVHLLGDSATDPDVLALT